MPSQADACFLGLPWHGCFIMTLCMPAGEALWSVDCQHGAIISPPLILQDGAGSPYLVIGTQNGVLQSLDGPTGEQLWRRHLGSRLSTGVTAFANLNGVPPGTEPPAMHRVVCCASNGDMTVTDVERSRAGEVLDACQLGTDVFSSPVAVGTFVVCGCRDDHLYCVHLL